MELVSVDPQMKEVIQIAETVAASKASVLIQGESGTGKERIAQWIHSKSDRSRGPWVAINCAAIPDTLLESELFGYEKGSFTGAAGNKPGKFELAHQGTLLLDEVSEMDCRLQAKLLRVLQEGEVDRLGGGRPRAVDVRVLATTNRHLPQAIRAGTFREDLFYRLNVVSLKLPPLRERMGDLPMLIKGFLKKYATSNHRPLLQLTEGALTKLQQYRWPGNIRELENVLERAVLLTSGSLLEASQLHWEGDPPLLLQEVPPPSSLTWKPGRTLEELERLAIVEALQHHQGNRTHAARSLGISIRTLRNKISDYKKLGLQL